MAKSKKEIKEEPIMVEEKQEVEVEKIPVEETSSQEKPEPKKRGRKKKVLTEEDELSRDTKVLLNGAKQKYNILSGILERIEVADNVTAIEGKIYGVTHFGNYKIIVPAVNMGIELPTDMDDEEKFSVYKKFMNSMLGAEIDYVVTKINDKEHIAVANRAIAMAIKRKKYYLNTYKNTKKSYMENCVEKAIPVPGKVMSVSGSLVRLDVYGVEVKVTAKEATWRYTPNLSDVFYPGEQIKVIIKSIALSEDRKEILKVEGSIREATPNTQVRNIAEYKLGCTCLGVVTGVRNDKGYNVAIGNENNGIDSFCTSVQGGVTPQIGDMVSCQLLKIDYDTGSSICKITRIIRQANQSRF